MLQKGRQKIEIMRHFYVFKDRKKQKKVLLIPSVVIVLKRNQKSGLKKTPQSVMLELYDKDEKKVIFSIEHPIAVFGFIEEATTTEVSNKVKCILLRIKMTGNPSEDFNK